jgi:serine/threonine protein kinase
VRFDTLMLQSLSQIDINNLHLGQILGEGAQGSVRLAVDSLSSTQIAIKILQKSSNLDLQAVSFKFIFRQRKNSKSITLYPTKTSSRCFLARKIMKIFIF